MRRAHAAWRAGVFEAYHAAMFPALWAEGLDLGDEAVIDRVATRAGLDAGELAAGAADPDVKDALRATTDEAVERGVFGAPTFFVGEEMFFGNDRLHFVEAALARGGRG
jgi:2-hydroxychromene-2-carboxylate isomerase